MKNIITDPELFNCTCSFSDLLLIESACNIYMFVSPLKAKVDKNHHDKYPSGLICLCAFSLELL